MNLTLLRSMMAALSLIWTVRQSRKVNINMPWSLHQTLHPWSFPMGEFGCFLDSSFSRDVGVLSSEALLGQRRATKMVLASPFFTDTTRTPFSKIGCVYLPQRYGLSPVAGHAQCPLPGKNPWSPCPTVYRVQLMMVSL